MITLGYDEICRWSIAACRYDLAGFADLEAQYGSYLFGYVGYFRQQLFAREQAHIKNMEDMKRNHNMSFISWDTHHLIFIMHVSCDGWMDVVMCHE